VQTRPAQQPVGQDVESQTHAPATHRCPVEHAGAAPHRQFPPAAQESAVTLLHARHAEPPEPQLATDAAVHTAPLQQPLGQLTPSHAPPVHTPPVQLWPAAHEGLEPQRHWPVAEQRLAFVGSHAMQESPPAPQLASSRGLQVLPEQQPVGHEVASQTHRPPTHRWPPAHASPGPQPQPPLAHESARWMLQEEQAPPIAPQLESDIALQVWPTQHPPGQDVASQTHAPPRHRWPVPQGTPAPHWQKPVAPHSPAFAGSQVRHAEARVPHVSRSRG
jgi:hypothetical protein